ncbi:hypothetical protein IWW38_001458 [Coemansia aciculifera]|uniref:Uncharacterized protein n=1 Tax=Coemansia aciculifera TaxID=417176 RepID=A0ACC1M6Y9_9FUNG|nr:hypothetical protein IWW38_001458 [Coemansia aciculifera]
MSPSATRFLLREMRLLTVPSHAAGLRADRYILSQVSIPSPLLHKLMRKRVIAHIVAEPNGTTKRIQGSDRVYEGMRIHIPGDLVTAASDAAGDKQNGDSSKALLEKRRDFAKQRLPMLFENDAMAVLQKPAGLSCQGGTGVRYSVDEMLADLDATEATGYRLVHRLDRDTTGALVVARSRLAAAALTAAFRDRAVSKRYIALLQGIPEEKSGTINNPLINTGTMTCVLSPADDERRAQLAKPATTKYRIMRTGKFGQLDVAIVELDILTGRKHQIRAHCAQVLKCPVLGDHRYNNNKAAVAANASMYLHLFEITVPDVDAMGNVRGKVSVKAPFPAFWSPVFKALGVSTKP